jgi:hypothetical protein
MSWLVLAACALAGGLALAQRRRRSARLARARSVAQELLPEIRSLLDSSDPTSPSDGEPTSPLHYQACHEQLPRVLSGEHYFAVETFYQCVESYREARALILEAFAEDDVRSLGDRIRAKDRRDRCLKDVYYTGHAAIQKLEDILA